MPDTQMPIGRKQNHILTFKSCSFCLILWDIFVSRYINEAYKISFLKRLSIFIPEWYKADKAYVELQRNEEVMSTLTKFFGIKLS